MKKAENVVMQRTAANVASIPGNGQGTSHATVAIRPPRFQVARFKIIGDEILVIHRFSAKAKQQLKAKMEAGKTASSRKDRKPVNINELYNEARYRSPQGWDGFNAAAIRAAMISACRLVNFKMTLAKLSIFVIADGRDASEPQFSLVRIYGTPHKQEDIAVVETGQPYVTIRPAYPKWHAFVTIRWDADQFTLEDITNLLHRVGQQVGIGEGRPDSKNSTGMGWGLFRIEQTEETKARASSPSPRSRRGRVHV